MDVNSNDWSKQRFEHEAQFCACLRIWECKKTGRACKDYLCPIVKESNSFEEFKKKINEGEWQLC